MGISSETTAQILARFHDDVILEKPRYAIMEGGVNSVAAAVSTASIISNISAMVDSCENNSIVPIYLKIFPWTGGTDAQNAQIDSINTKIDSLKTVYPTLKTIDTRAALGEFRGGGDAGNKWNIQSAYSAGDGIHFNPLANTVIAQLIVDSLHYTGYSDGYIDNSGMIYTFPDSSGQLALTDQYTFTSGLTNTSNTVTNDLITGKAGGQTAVGGTASGNNLTLSSTTNATKGKVILGTASAYDQANDLLGLGLTTPLFKLHTYSTAGGDVSINSKR
jgi:lysophospholipase L1-like esterase